jgi:ABC-type antimicrobial peptide transport system permease subunit
VRAELTRLDPDLPVAKVRTLEGERRRAVAQPRFNLELMGLFGVLALALSAVGVYGVVSAWVASRTREIGVRMALGARPLDVLTLVATRGARPALFGVAAGSLVAAAGARLLASQLHGASPAAPAAWLAAPAVVLASAALASLAPALRASRTPPAAALHTE